MSDNPFQSPRPGAPLAPPIQPRGNSLYVACPNCGASDSAKVGFTWWGGLVGPAMFCHVKCPYCHTAYNGKTGQSNNTKIAIYIAVSFAVIIGIFIAAISAGLMNR